MLDFLKKFFSTEDKEKDPVCGMVVDSGKSIQTVVAGKTYFFCSTSCKDQFEANPGNFLGR